MARTAKIEVYMDAAGEYRWRYRATNGQIMADGGEGYVERRNCVNGALKVLGLQIAEYRRRQGGANGPLGPRTPYMTFGGGLYYFFRRDITGRDADVELVRRES